MAHQLAEDGTMPLLQAVYGPTMVNGDFWEPNNRAYMVGPSVKVHQVTHKQARNGCSHAQILKTLARPFGKPRKMHVVHLIVNRIDA
jgi:hypothetical protein